MLAKVYSPSHFFWDGIPRVEQNTSCGIDLLRAVQLASISFLVRCVHNCSTFTAVLTLQLDMCQSSINNQ